MSKITETRKTVNQILMEYPASRDNDNLLILMVLSKLGLDVTIPMSDYVLGESDKYPSFEAITRMRRCLQNEHEEYRGKKWYERHAYQEEFVDELHKAMIDELNMGVQLYKEQHGIE